MTSSTQPPTLVFEIRGVRIPAVGLGTFQSDNGNDQVQDVVAAALRRGYRHIDTAWAYGNEAAVGRAIKESGVRREELFITTKLGQTWHDPSEVDEALEESLRNLQLDYVDLYLMHFPYAYQSGPNHSSLRREDGKPFVNRDLSRSYDKTWQAMEKLVDSGKARLIGMSNFNILKTKRILANARIRPAVIQVELHPYLPQNELLEFCSQEGIHLTAHQPLGGRPIASVSPNAGKPGPLIDPDIAEIAAKYHKSPAQVLLSWSVQRGASVVPKTVSESRLTENLDLFRLSDEDMVRISGIAEKRGSVRFLDPRNHVGFDIFDEEHDQPVT